MPFSRLGALTVMPFIRGNGRSPLKGWTFSGIIRRAFSCELPAVNCGEFTELSAPPIVRVPLRLHAPVAAFHLRYDGQIVSASAPDPKQEDASLTIAPVSSLKVGSFRTEVEVQAVGPGRERLSKESVVVVGKKTLDIIAVPEVIPLGALTIGTVHCEEIMLFSRAKAPFMVQAIDYDERQFSRVELLHEEPDDSGRCYRLAVRCNDLGDHVVTAGFRVSTAVGGQVIPVRISYHGMPSPQLE
jgi:hypothetical protein